MSNSVPAPLLPPTESGWYVVEDESRLPEIVFITMKHKKTWVHIMGKSDLFMWNEFHITRYTGPLDLERLLEQGGKDNG